MVKINNSAYQLTNKHFLQNNVSSDNKQAIGTHKQPLALSDGLKKLIQQIAPYRNEASLTPQEKEKAHIAGLYSISAYLDDKKLAKKQDLNTVAGLHKQYSELSENDAKFILQLNEKKLDSAQKLQQQFPKLTNADAHELNHVLQNLNVNIYHDQESNQTILAARGTASIRDVKQDVMTGLGATGAKYKALDQLRPLLLAGEIKPDLYTGHSLGGGMASAIANMMGDSDAQVMTFDAQRLNIKQNKLSKEHSNDIPTTDYRIDSSLSLGALMSVPVLFKNVDTVGLPSSPHTTKNPINKLVKNHSIDGIISKMDNPTTHGNLPMNAGLKQHLTTPIYKQRDHTAQI